MTAKLKFKAIRREEFISKKFHLKNRPVHTAYINPKIINRQN